MDLSSLSNEELTQNLRCPAPTVTRSEGTPSESLDDVVQELHVHRVELEMQNRALRETEMEIESALQRYCDLYDHLPIGYVTLTRTGKIVQANLTAAGWLRHDRERLVGGYFHWFLDAFDAGRFAGHLESCVQTAAEQTLELTLRLKSGLLLTVQLTSRIAPPGEKGEQHVHTAITNISKLKQAHAVNEDIDREQEMLTESIADHLRTPVATISIFARSILRDHASELSSDVQGVIERMECAAVRMESTLQHLLEYCCVGYETIALDPVNLEELMQQVIMEHRATLQHHRAEVAVDRPLPCVRGAHLLLAQVVANVLTNALKHTRAGDTPRIRVSAERVNHEIVFKISDEGTSLEGANAEQNFRVFERLREKDCYWGSGIGLAIVRRTIERMHGRVWVESELGKANCFSIALPAV